MNATQQDNQKTPRSIGVIMDGNRRWAKQHGLPTLEGHRKGYEKLKELLGWCREKGVSNVTVYAFSTENWNRKKEEVSYLMDLFRLAIKEIRSQAKANHVRVVFPGDAESFPDDIRALMQEVMSETTVYTSMQLAVAVSYGGRAEIIQAIKKIPEGRHMNISEEEFSNLLWSSNIPDPDMIIRTSGEKRLSGFLTWKSVYSELFFTDTYWPAFSKQEFIAMLEEYAARERRYGS